MRVFLTGGTGFVGHHMARALAARGDDVVALVRHGSDTSGLVAPGCDAACASEISGKRESNEISDRSGGAPSSPGGRVSLAEGTLFDADRMARLMDGCDAVIHCAGAIKALAPEGFFAVNAGGSETAVKAARMAGVRRFHMVSSIAARGPITGPGQCAPPVSHYGRSKREGEGLVLQAAGPVEVTFTRPPPVYGPRDLGMLAVFKAAAAGVFPLYGRGRSRVAMVHVSDVVGAILSLVLAPAPVPVGPYYPEDGSNPSWSELASAFEAAAGRRARRIPLPPALFWTAAACATAFSRIARRPAVFGLDKVREMSCPDWTASAADLTAATGWRARVPLQDGLAQTMRWYRGQGWVR